jgi:hypothetical protein
MVSLQWSDAYVNAFGPIDFHSIHRLTCGWDVALKATGAMPDAKP